MPRRNPPTLRRHKRGQFFVRWGGQDHWLGTDRAAAEQKFFDPASENPGSLAAWFAWQNSKPTARKPAQRLRVVELVERFCDRYEDQGRILASRYHRKHLNRFTHALGRLFAHELTTDIVSGFATSMHELRFADKDRTALSPSTINKDIKAARSLLRWAVDMELCPPVRVRRLELLPEQPADPQDVSIDVLQKGVTMAQSSDPRVELALRLHYMTLARPSELIALLWRHGRFLPMPPGTNVPDGIDPDRSVFKLDTSKSQHRTGLHRFLVLSPQALAVLDQTRLATQNGKQVPIDSRSGRRFWKTPSGYAQSLRDDDKVGAPFPTSVVRPSAATHLHYQGVERAVVDRALGHIPRGAGRNYIREDWTQLLAAVARLRL